MSIFKKGFIIVVLLSIFMSILAVGCQDKNMLKGVMDTPNSDNTLVWNLSSVNINTWDPHFNANSVSGDIINQLFEGLTVLGENGYELGVAESFEVTSNDEGAENTVYTFKLRKDAKWSDGQNVTAEDFEYSFKRACDPTIGGTSADLFKTYIKGADKYNNGTGSKDDMKVKAIDKYTLKIELNNPTPYFMEILASQQFIPMRKDIVEKNGIGWETNPETCISNGPFKLISYNPSSDLLLSKNNYYYDSKNVKIPYIKCLINTNNDNIDLMYDKNEIHVTQIYAYGDLKNEDILKTNHIGSSYIVFNNHSNIFSDVNVRKAFSYSIDRKYICEQVYYGALPATNLVPSDIKLSSGEDIEVKRKSDVNLYKVQSENSKKLLKLAGYDNNFPEVRLVTHNEYLGNSIKSMIEDNLDVKVNLIVVSYEELIERQLKGDFDMIIDSWVADYNDPMTFLDNFKSNSNLNFSGWSSKDYDSAIENSMKSQGLNRDNYLINAESVLMDDMVIAPLYFYNKYYRVKTNLVENIKSDVMGKLIIKHAKLNLKDISSLNTDNKTDGLINEGAYGFDDRNRIEEIDKNGYFNDSANNRFDKYLVSDHFEIYYSSSNENSKIYASNAIEVLEEDYDRILEFLNVEEENMPIVKISMYEEYEPFRQCLIKEKNFDGDTMEGLQGMAVYSNTIYYTYKYKGSSVDTPTILKHEFTHNVTMALAQDNYHPDWLLEGVAMYLSQEKDRSEPYYEELLKNGIPQIYTLIKNNKDKYIYGYSMVEYIIEEYGREKLVELLMKYGDIQKVLNISEDEFRDGWIEFLEEKIE